MARRLQRGRFVIASSASTASPTPTVAFVPSARATASPARPSSVRVSPSVRHAAATRNEAASRSFCVVTDWSAISVSVPERSAAKSDAGRVNPTRRAQP